MLDARVRPSDPEDHQSGLEATEPARPSQCHHRPPPKPNRGETDGNSHRPRLRNVDRGIHRGGHHRPWGHDLLLLQQFMSGTLRSRSRSVHDGPWVANLIVQEPGHSTDSPCGAWVTQLRASGAPRRALGRHFGPPTYSQSFAVLRLVRSDPVRTVRIGYDGTNSLVSHMGKCESWGVHLQTPPRPAPRPRRSTRPQACPRSNHEQGHSKILLFHVTVNELSAWRFGINSNVVMPTSLAQPTYSFGGESPLEFDAVSPRVSFGMELLTFERSATIRTFALLGST